MPRGESLGRAGRIGDCQLQSRNARCCRTGKLRFTAAAEQQASGLVAGTSLPTSQGLLISFKQYQYGGYGLDGPGSPGGDGIALFLAVALMSPSAPRSTNRVQFRPGSTVRASLLPFR